MTTSTYYFKRLSETDDIQSFHCGDEPWQIEVSNFLKENALNEQLKGCNLTWLCYSNAVELQGYVSLIASSIRLAYSDEYRPPSLDEVEREYFPCVLIGQFGVNTAYQRQGRGQYMLDWAIGLVTELRIGVKFLTAHVEHGNNNGLCFWYNQGFKVSKKITPDNPIHLAYDLYST